MSSRRFGSSWTGGLALLLAAASGCGVQPIEDKDETTSTAESELSLCRGPKPTPGVCEKVVCLGGDASWELTPLPSGTACPGGGTCDGAGSCVVPEPILPLPGDWNFNQANGDPDHLQANFQCGGHATNHQVWVSKNGGPDQKLGWSVINCQYPEHFLYVGEHLGMITPGARYCFYAVGSNDWYTAQGYTGCVTTIDDQRVIDTPTARVDVNARRGSATLYYTDRATNEYGYRVYLRNVTDGGAYGLVQDHVRPDQPDRSTGDELSVTVDNLDPAKLYQFKIDAWHDHKPVVSTWEYPVFQPLPNPPSSLAPVTIGPSIGTNFMTVLWTLPAGETRESIVADVMPGTRNLLPPNDPSWTFSGLLPGTTYCFSVFARNAGGDGPRTQVCGTTKTAPMVDQHFAVQMVKQPVTSGVIPYAGSFGPIFAGAVVTSVNFPTSLPPVYLVLPGHSTAECGLASASILVSGEMTAAQKTQVWGTATPTISGGTAKLPFVGCTSALGLQSLQANITWHNPP